jgi:hypothetical protein
MNKNYPNETPEHMVERLAQRRAYNQRPEVRARALAYNHTRRTPEFRARERARRQRITHIV